MTIEVPTYLSGESAKQYIAWVQEFRAGLKARKAAQASGTPVQPTKLSEPYEDTTPKGLMGSGSHPIGE